MSIRYLPRFYFHVPLSITFGSSACTASNCLLSCGFCGFAFSRLVVISSIVLIWRVQRYAFFLRFVASRREIFQILQIFNLVESLSRLGRMSELFCSRCSEISVICLSKLKNAFSPPRILFSLLPPAELRSSSARLARPRTRGGRLLYQSLREKSFKSFKIIFIFVWFVGFGLSAFLLRTSAIQASLMALGLSSVLPRKVHSFSRVS